MIWLAVGFALASAATTALSTATQHHSAGEAPREAGPIGLMRFLVRRPVWIGALILGPVGFTLHALALHHGPISLVQPLAIMGIVFAVPIRAAWSRAWPSRDELLAVVATATAIAVLLLASDPEPAANPPGLLSMLPAVLVCGGFAAGLFVVSGGVRHPAGRAFALGCVAGVLFGLMAVLMKASSLYAGEHGVVGLFLTWIPYVLVAAGLTGITVNQVAYRAARLSASMPVLNVVNCLLTLAFGYLVLHERPNSEPAALAAMGVAVVAMAWGLWQLARQEPVGGVGSSRNAPTTEPEGARYERRARPYLT